MQAQEAHLAGAAALLSTLGDHIEDIERHNDIAAMRDVVRLLVRRIVIRTEEDGRRKRATATAVFAFNPASPSSSSEIPTVSHVHNNQKLRLERIALVGRGRIEIVA